MLRFMPATFLRKLSLGQSRSLCGWEHVAYGKPGHRLEQRRVGRKLEVAATVASGTCFSEDDSPGRRKPLKTL